MLLLAGILLVELLELGQVPQVTSLGVLGHSGEGEVASSSQDQCLADVDGAGVATIKMLVMINAVHLKSITREDIPS